MEGIKDFEATSEQRVIEKITAGDVELFEILVRRNNAYLYKVGRSYGYNHHDTEDLMQDTFINAFIGLSKFQNRSSFRTWLVKIMLNNCFQKQRKFSFKNEITDKSLSMFSETLQADANKEIVNNELRKILESSLQQLPVDYRMVFSFREITGFSVAETAEVLEISESNVKVRLNRARSMLRKQLEKSYNSSEIFEFNAKYCDAMVQRVFKQIHLLKQSAETR